MKTPILLLALSIITYCHAAVLCPGTLPVYCDGCSQACPDGNICPNCVATSAPLEMIYGCQNVIDFVSDRTGVLETCHDFRIPTTDTYITACGYRTQDSAPMALFVKNSISETDRGLGLNEDPNNEHEISKLSFIQLDTIQMQSLAFNPKIMMGGLKSREAYEIYGSNTRATLGELLITGDSSTFFDLPSYPTYRYINIKAGGPVETSSILISKLLFACAPTSAPTIKPSFTPTVNPTLSPTYRPSIAPTSAPTITISPSMIPTNKPTKVPTSAPTSLPTSSPTTVPTSTPTSYPTAYVTFEPTVRDTTCIPEGNGVDYTDIGLLKASFDVFHYIDNIDISQFINDRANFTRTVQCSLNGPYTIHPVDVTDYEISIVTDVSNNRRNMQSSTTINQVLVRYKVTYVYPNGTGATNEEMVFYYNNLTALMTHNTYDTHTFLDLYSQYCAEPAACMLGNTTRMMTFDGPYPYVVTAAPIIFTSQSKSASTPRMHQTYYIIIGTIAGCIGIFIVLCVLFFFLRGSTKKADSVFTDSQHNADNNHMHLVDFNVSESPHKLPMSEVYTSPYHHRNSSTSRASEDQLTHVTNIHGIESTNLYDLSDNGTTYTHVMHEQQPSTATQPYGGYKDLQYDYRPHYRNKRKFTLSHPPMCDLSTSADISNTLPLVHSTSPPPATHVVSSSSLHRTRASTVSTINTAIFFESGNGYILDNTDIHNSRNTLTYHEDNL